MAGYVDEWLNKYPSIKAFNKLLRRGRITLTTVENYVKSIKAFCEITGYSDPESSLGAIREVEEIEDWLDSLVEKISKKVGNTRCVNIMKGVKWWLDLNKVDVDWRDIILPSVEAIVEDRAPTKPEIRKLLSFGNIRDQSLILVASTSGLRMNALRTLTFGDVNFDYSDPDVARIIVKRHYEVNGKTYKSGRKISKKRRLFVTFISPEAKKALLQYKQYRIDEGENVTDKSPLFTSMRKDELGQFLAKRYLSTHWGRLLKKAHLDEKSGGWFILHFHTLKKFAETQFINAGVKKSYREFWLGHKGAYLETSYFRGEEAKHLEEYRKAISYLTIAEKPVMSEVERRKKTMIDNARLLGWSDERLAKFETFLQGCITMRQLDTAPKDFLKEETETDCQKIVSEGELEAYLSKGWRFVAMLSNGKVIIDNNH